MNEFEYYMAEINNDKRFGIIKNISFEFDDSFLLDEGEILGDEFPKNIVFNIHPQSGDWITDFINNIDSCVIISSKVKGVFEQEGLTEEKVEYLPFIIKDKKGRKINTPYYIANVLVTRACFDYEKSSYKTYPKRPKKILSASIENLILLKDKLEDDDKFFRVTEDPTRIFLRSDLLERIKKEGFTGLAVVKEGDSLIDYKKCKAV